MLRRRGAPGVGAFLLLVVGVVLLVAGGEDEEGGERDGPKGERAEDDRRSPGGGDADRRPPGVPARVTRVVDGDTIEASIDGEVADVRYIGVDTPESVAPGQPVECFGKRASAFNERLVEGEAVRLRFDRERRDRYGRLLAYVYAGPRFVNAELVRRGYARTLEIEPNTAMAGLLGRLEDRAGRLGRGLWDAC